MADHPNNPFTDAGGEFKPQTGQYQHQPVAARVPEKVVRGVYCTGQIVLDSPKEFVIDFLQGLTRPFQVGARVVMTPQTVHEFILAMQQNVEAYQKTHGAFPQINTPPQERRPTIEEIYEHYKVPDDMHSGAYANTVLMGHSQSEFFFDFITGFYPTSAVSARVLLAAGQAPRFLNTLRTSLQQYQARYLNNPQQQDPPPPQQPQHPRPPTHPT